jgi:hypothetical protein
VDRLALAGRVSLRVWADMSHLLRFERNGVLDARRAPAAFEPKR